MLAEFSIEAAVALAKRFWKPALFGALLVALAVQHGCIKSLRKDLATRTDERDRAQSSLAGWKKSAEDYAAANAGLNDRIDTQNAALDTMAARKRAADQFAIDAAAEAVKAQAELNTRTLEWEERAHAHPEDVRTLGHVACDIYRSLYGNAATCAGSAANAQGGAGSSLDAAGGGRH